MKAKQHNQGSRCTLKSDFKAYILKSLPYCENWNIMVMTVLEKSSFMTIFRKFSYFFLILNIGER